MKMNLLELMRVRNIIGRDVEVYHGASHEYLRGPIESITAGNMTVSFVCKWLAKRETNHNSWSLRPGETKLEHYPITAVESDDPYEEEIIIPSPVGYLIIKGVGDSLEQPA